MSQASAHQAEFLLECWFSAGGNSAPKGTFGEGWALVVLMASREQRPEMLLNLLPVHRAAPQQRGSWPQVPELFRLGNSVLGAYQLSFWLLMPTDYLKILRNNYFIDRSVRIITTHTLDLSLLLSFLLTSSYLTLFCLNWNRQSS